MDCPRCGDALERYALEGREAVACADCGYIGVPVEHRGEYRTVESWEEAISRLAADRPASAVTVEVGDPTPTPSALDGTGNGNGSGSGDRSSPNVVRIEYGDADELPTCDVCGKAFDSRRQLHGHSAVHADGEE